MSSYSAPSVLRSGTRAQPRSPADVLGFIDADMLAWPEVVEQATRAIAEGAVAVIVPERTVGQGFWGVSASRTSSRF